MVQSDVRRQLVGSIVMASIIAAFAVLAAFRPVHTARIAVAAHGFPTVQQPVMATFASDRLAATSATQSCPGCVYGAAK